MGSPIITSPALRHTLARNLRHQLRLLEISENECSKRSGVSQKQVNNIANERTGCSVEAVDWIARALNIPAWILICPGFQDLPQDRIHKLARLVQDYVSLDDASMNMIESSLQVASRMHGRGSKSSTKAGPASQK